MISRRSLITGLATVLAAPAVIRVAQMMPVKAWDDGLVKCTQRFLRGSHGTIAFSSAVSVDPFNNWGLVGAGETIRKGDLITIRADGYAYPVRATDLKHGLERCGIALSSSAGHDLHGGGLAVSGLNLA